MAELVTGPRDEGREGKSMRMRRCLGLAGLLVLLLAQAAEANQPPGPHLLLAEVALLPLVLLLSGIGGAYAVLRARTAFPMFPYNYLTTQPLYRADSSSQIRMVAVHDRETACPPDAPVVARVSEEEIARMQRLLEGSGECP